ncbi:partial Dihydropteroate synthase, partial [uncultured bacterium]
MLDLTFLAELCARHADSLNSTVAAFDLRGERFEPWPDVSLMGVVNLSPDSWYRESVAMTVEAAVRRGHRLAVEGARIIDVGAESTILDARRVDAKTQASILVPVVRQLSDLGLLVSAETYSTEVTQVCLEAGAAVVNLTAAADTESFYRLAAEHGAGVIVCYVQNGGNVREVGDFQLGADHGAA